MVEDLLSGFVGAPWVRELDFSTLKKLSTDYVVEGLDERIGDVVWEVGRRRGDSVYVFIILEFQSRSDPLMALRILGYVVLFYQRLLKERPLAPGEKLPPVFPVVFYNGEEPYGAAVEVSDLIAARAPELRPYQPSMRYVLIDELRQPCSGFEGEHNAVATFLRLQQEDPPGFQELVATELDWLAEENPGLLRALLEWMSLVLFPDRQPNVPVPKFKSLDELKGYMEKDMRTWSEILKAEGKAEGQVEGQATILLSQIEAKFGEPGDDVIQQVRTADSEHLLTWAKRVLTAQRLDDVFNGSPA